MATINEYLKRMVENDASDLHLVVGQHPKYVLRGEVEESKELDLLTPESLQEMLFEVLSEEQVKIYTETHDLDFAHAIEGVARFRCNYFYQRTGMAAVFRIIPSKIMTLDQLKMPSVLKDFCECRSGLILVTGPTGSGKTTTLAAMINEINEHQRQRILTIEDPVEFVHPNKKSLITHREVHRHTNSFSSALRAATRQDADVVLVGELRDMETMGLALSAAAMGTLVFGTLHTNSAAKTIDRVIDIFPTDQQATVRTMLAESLAAIVAQQLLKTADGKGRVAIPEILVGNQSISSIIREGKIERIVSVMQSGRGEGMQIMDDVLEQYVKEGVVTGRDAYMKANEKRRFEQYAEDAA